VEKISGELGKIAKGLGTFAKWCFGACAKDLLAHLPKFVGSFA
jgi:hypothetical protein